MPDPAPPGKVPGEVVVATGAIYGAKDTGGKWYFHLKAALAHHGIYESALERGLYRLVLNGKLVMMIHTHVDDLLVAVKQNCKAALDIIAKLQKELYLKGGFKKTFEYLARVVEVDDQQIRITQPKSVKSIDLITVPIERRRTPDSPVTDLERSEMRSLLGSLQWLCQQSRVDITVAVSAHRGLLKQPSETYRNAIQSVAVCRRHRLLA